MSIHIETLTAPACLKLRSWLDSQEVPYSVVDLRDSSFPFMDATRGYAEVIVAEDYQEEVRAIIERIGEEADYRATMYKEA